jgi:iron complex outermembrane receptor protein
MQHWKRLAAGLVIPMVACPVLAQTVATSQDGGGANELEEVIVTAERRSEDLQTTPIVISATSGEELRELHLNTIQDLQLTTPSLSDDPSAGNLLHNLNIRGIGQTAAGSPGITPGVEVFHDGLLAGETTALDIPFFDIRDTEVLEGPQGTLGGGSSTAGALYVNSNDPNFRGANGFIESQVGTYTDKKVDGAVNLPVTDTLAFRIAFNEEQRNSFYSNQSALVTPGDSKALVDIGKDFTTDVRVSALWKPTSNFQALIKYEYDTIDYGGVALEPDPTPYTTLFDGASCGATGPNGSIVCPGPGTVAHSTFYYAGEKPLVLNYGSLGAADDIGGVKDYYKALYSRYSLDLRYTLPGDIVLRSISGFQNVDISYIAWNSYAPANDGFHYHELGPDDDYYSEEIDLLSPTDGKVNWVAGAFWFYRNTPVNVLSETVRPPYAATASPAVASDITIGSGQRIAAVFANVDWHVTNTLQLQVGVRENWDNDFDYQLPTDGVYVWPYLPPNTLPGTPTCPTATLGGSLITCIPNKGHWTDSTPTGKVDLSWTPLPGQNIYAFYTRGYKSGGVNSDPTSPNPTFKPEYVNDYEVGWKGQLLDGHILTQADVYWMDYINMQYPVYDIYNVNVGNGDDENLAPSTIKGLELSAQSKLGPVGVSFGVDYNIAKLGSLTLLNSGQLPPGTAFGTATAPNQCPASGPIAGCFNYLPYEQTVSGEQIPLAPKLTANGSVDYSAHVGTGVLRPRLTFSYFGSQYSSVFETPYYYMGPRHILGANLDYSAGPWFLELYGTNLTNQIYESANLGGTVAYGAPRQFGFRFSYAIGGG